MKSTMLAVLLTAVAVSACSSAPKVKGPFARSAQGTETQTDASLDNAPQADPSPFPVQTPFGN
ncbi:MAG TPA: hypothetical protein VFJ70_02515 [Burkholderiales bacterium]|nr:hypothetical protein [Burkholderiales bacterium]